MAFALETDEQAEAFLRADEANPEDADLAIRIYYQRRALGDTRLAAALAGCQAVIDLLTNDAAGGTQ